MKSGEVAAKVWRINGLTYTTAGLVILFALMLTGDFFWALKDRSMGMITKILFKKYGASDFLNGILIFSLPAVMGMIIGPVISYKSDRHRGRLGRRIPYLLATTPIACAGMVGLAFSAPIGQWLAGVWHLDADRTILICLAVSWMIFEFGMVIAGSVFQAFANDVVPTELLGRFYGFFRIVSLAAGVVFSYWLLGWSETHSLWLFLGVAVLYGIGMMILCFGVREGTYPPPPAELSGSPGGRRIQAVRSYFQECFSHPFYLLIFFGLLMLGLCFSPVNTYLVFYAKSLHLPLSVYGKYISYSFIGSAILAVPVGMLADRFHPLRVSVLVLTAYMIAAFAGFGFIADPGLTWVSQQWIGLMSRFGVRLQYDFATAQEAVFAAILISHSILGGMWATATASLSMRLLPRDRYAQFSSAGGIISTLVNILMIPAFGWILDLTGNEYRYLFIISGVLAAVGIVFNIWICLAMRGYGGIDHYRAPAV